MMDVSITMYVLLFCFACFIWFCEHIGFWHFVRRMNSRPYHFGHPNLQIGFDCFAYNYIYSHTN